MASRSGGVLMLVQAAAYRDPVPLIQLPTRALTLRSVIVRAVAGEGGRLSTSAPRRLLSSSSSCSSGADDP